MNGRAPEINEEELIKQFFKANPNPLGLPPQQHKASIQTGSKNGSMKRNASNSSLILNTRKNSAIPNNHSLRKNSLTRSYNSQDFSNLMHKPNVQLQANLSLIRGKNRQWEGRDHSLTEHLTLS
jgi:hypothetical protein